MTKESADNYYNPLMLWGYDVFVQVLTNSFWWRCSTKGILVPFFLDNSTTNHMEVGAGTGYFLRAKLDHERSKLKSSDDKTLWPQNLTLVDFHERCMNKAANRISPVRPNRVLANIMEPIPLKGQKFDSIAIMYVLHCIAATPEAKGRVFANLKPFLADEGTLFGSTVLGKGVKHNLIGGFLMWLYNYIGMFDNWDDGKEDFLKPLREHFEVVESEVVGTVLLFKAEKPRH
uniref:Methyltransferase aurB n=1 Tax=Calcarisporium arbuscula TaxID=240499 RepID=AURB_CALAK|nr:RecName: Full=Methyltransferase aurB; AltName: Full=Aurovertin biosynthesis cluster protein B [Calcarisporium arbuscula]ALD83628.1 O-methyltransferase [Calcarisporium arbuscula]